MNRDSLSSLSARQAECLRLVARDRDAKEIGRLLGISDETVERHIKLAMRKLGANSRFSAARALAEFEGRDHPVVMPPARAATPASPTPSYEPDAVTGHAGAVERELREERMTFDLSETPPAPTISVQTDRNRMSIGLRLSLCVALFLALAVGVAGIGAVMQQLSGWVHVRAQSKSRTVHGPDRGTNDVEQTERRGSGRGS